MNDVSPKQPPEEPPPFAPGEAAREDPPRPTMPVMPDRPPIPGDRRRSVARRLVSLVMAVLGLGVLGGILLVCTMGNVAALLVAGGVFAFGAVHYLLWGWWLSNSIHRQAREAGQQPPPRR